LRPFSPTFCIAKRAVAALIAKVLVAVVTGAGAVAAAHAQGSPAPGAAPVAASAASTARQPAWIGVPRVVGRLTAADIGLVINSADPYSVEVGEFYARARRIPAAQILRVELPVRPALTVDEYERFAKRLNAHFGVTTQALALAWVQPYAVGCNSLNGALALGYDAALCSNTCAASRPSRYFNTSTARPFTDLQLRPSMLLAAQSVAQAKALIERGVAADNTLGLRGAPPAHAYFVSTSDAVRSQRDRLFPPAGLVRGAGIDVHVERTEALENVDRVLLYMTGAIRVAKLDTIAWLPGGVGDHLTSYGGALEGVGDQMSALEWLSSGATASYGTSSEPCSHLQKFPHPQLLLQHYAQGSTVLEAYWKSVAWPQQGVFVGEPLAAPFSRVKLP